MSQLTHINAAGEAHMVDVSGKAETVREARAEAYVEMQATTLAMIIDGSHHKGDVFATARIAGIQAASGLLVARGGRTSHAAVVARQLGKVCVVNCQALSFDPYRHRCSIGKTALREGDMISLDGDTGRIYGGVVTTVEDRPIALVRTARAWGSQRR